MKNYYEILQVNNKASKFVIDKVYRTLAKQYHPDANTEENKKWAEEKFKEINEAYEVLSDDSKRKAYDENLERENQANNQEIVHMKEMYNDMVKQNEILKNELNILKAKVRNNYYPNNSASNNNVDFNKEMYNKYYKAYQDTVKRAYYDAYIQRMKDYGYKIVHKRTLKDIKKDFFSLIITLGILLITFFILWQIPAIREYIKSIFFWIIAI